MVFLFSAKMGNVYTFKLLHWTVVEASKSGLNSISISVTNSKADNDLGIGSSYLFIFILSYSNRSNNSMSGSMSKYIFTVERWQPHFALFTTQQKQCSWPAARYKNSIKMTLEIFSFNNIFLSLVSFFLSFFLSLSFSNFFLSFFLSFFIFLKLLYILSVLSLK